MCIRDRFKGTIRQNLLWGNASATDDELWEALTIAQAKEVVEGKDNQLDAPVEQGGVNFSGGQRQRLTIARALVRKPRILILDDSASALDYATDAQLRMAIRRMENPDVYKRQSMRRSESRKPRLSYCCAWAWMRSPSLRAWIGQTWS